MKILIDPTMAILIKDMPESECAELLHCIFEYPKRDSDLIVWKYMKTQIDRDAQKYREKCERLAAVRPRSQKSVLKSEQKSTVIESSKDNHNEKHNVIAKDIVSSNAENIVENPVENFDSDVDIFRVNDSFSFEILGNVYPEFKKYTSFFSPEVVERAERTLRQKRKGQHLSMKQIIMWLEQENTFYQQNHRSE